MQYCSINHGHTKRICITCTYKWPSIVCYNFYLSIRLARNIEYISHSNETTKLDKKYLYSDTNIHTLSLRLRRHFSHPGKSSVNIMEDTMLSGVYRCQRSDRRLPKWSFRAKVKHSLKHYTSELGPAKLYIAWMVASDTASLDGKTWMSSGV